MQRLKNPNRDKLTWAWFEYGTMMERLRNARYFTPFDEKGIAQIEHECDRVRNVVIKLEAEIVKPDESL